MTAPARTALPNAGLPARRLISTAVCSGIGTPTLAPFLPPQARRLINASGRQCRVAGHATSAEVLRDLCCYSTPPRSTATLCVFPSHACVKSQRLDSAAEHRRREHHLQARRRYRSSQALDGNMGGGGTVRAVYGASHCARARRRSGTLHIKWAVALACNRAPPPPAAESHEYTAAA